MRLSTLLFLFFALFLAAPAQSQQLDHVQGQVMIRLEPDTDIERVTTRLKTFQGKSTRLEVKEELSSYMRIWLLEFDFTTINEFDFLGYLNRFPGIEVAQWNHLISFRNTPDDPQFDDQWQYINTGQTGGVVGADIDADLAWDIATGGVTPNGDTIVVCIIDDGLDPDHPDFVGNVWVNHDEIPGNGIDDDNNGYVDDYQGWNTSEGTDDTDVFNGHGTPVAGIVGAKGNNGIGVAGVNWDVKLMIVFGGTGVESEVIEAYSFPLTHRMRYNETNGEEGSFVVSTNASWGVDFGQPANAPLWCAFYDTLGVHGIVSCGATINGNVNVDEQGDLPTACPSDYLISVTNMNDQDVKVTGAGYGIETIDLGAFGAGTWTAAEGGYGSFGGTSGATPHVSGAIALLYSAPCSELSSLALSNPAQAAQLAKQYILDGVVPNASLDGITSTGGKLNLFNSLQLVLQNCGGCTTPFGLDATDVTNMGAVLSWTESDSTLSTNLRWRPVGTMDWNEVENASTPYPLEGLDFCTDYEYQVQALCNSDTTDYSPSFVFQTVDCCELPTTVEAFPANTEVQITWEAANLAESYILELTTPSGTTTLTPTDNGAFVFDLLECTVYSFNLQVVCTTGDTSMVSEDQVFTTLGCGACLDLAYCEASGITEFEFIQQVDLNTFSNISGDDGGYGDYTGLTTTNLSLGGTYDLVLVPGWQGQSYGEFFKVWIDWDQDGSFEGTGELVFELTESTEDPVTGEITVPTDAILGNTRMRVGMVYEDFNGGLLESCFTEIEGEFEDYCLTIDDDLVPCDQPVSIIADPNYEELTISWAAVTGAEDYDVRIREVGVMDWDEVTDIVNVSFVFSGLSVCTEYEVQVKANCSESSSDYTSSITFSTLCNPPCMEVPMGLDTTEVGMTEAMLSWDMMGSALSYNIRLKETAAMDWIDFNTEDAFITVVDLMECTEYEVQIGAVCEGVENFGPYTESMVFTTDCMVNSAGEIQDVQKAQVIPNPFKEDPVVQLNLATAAQVELSLYEVNGKQIWTTQYQLGGGTHTLPLNTTEALPGGVYLLKLTTGTSTWVQKVVKQ
jgi:serine protease